MINRLTEDVSGLKKDNMKVKENIRSFSVDSLLKNDTAVWFHTYGDLSVCMYLLRKKRQVYITGLMSCQRPHHSKEQEAYFVM